MSETKKERPGRGAPHENSLPPSVPANAEDVKAEPKRHRNLYEHSWQELHRASAIDPEVIAERGYRTCSRPTNTNADSRNDLDALGIPTWATREDSYFPGLLIPLWGVNSRVVSYQFKPRNPVSNREGKRMKYASAKGRSAVLDVHPRWTRDRGEADASQLPYIQDVTKPLVITEGIKKADALTSQGVVTIGLSGVWNWRSGSAPLGDWEGVALKGRTVTILFDADAHEKPQILDAMKRLGQFLRSRGAGKVWYLVCPAEVNGTEVKGVDDYLAAGGSLTELVAGRTGVCPKPAGHKEDWTQSRLAEILAEEELAGSYLYTAALGWLHWTGRQWVPADGTEVLEAVRSWTRTKYADALAAKAEEVKVGKLQPETASAVEGWGGVQSRDSLNSVLTLTKGMLGVFADAAEFDTDTNLLNTATGVVDLRTGDLLPFDPELRMTKMTAVGYVPGAESADWKQALSALPDDVPDWLQVELGAAVACRPADHLTLFTGGGRNGKTALVGSVFRVLAGERAGRGYAAKVPNQLLLKGKNLGGATPERMTLRGIRMAYLEETPDNGYLDAQTLKDLIDAEEIEGRHLYKDIVSWRPTHSLYLNTNHPPLVTDTDDGTWRRLVRVDFPYRYRKATEALELPGDRYGDSTIKDRLTNPAKADPGVVRANQEAILAWLIQGAGRAIAASSEDAPSPASVVASVKLWRATSDDLLRFIEDRMEFDQDAWVATSDLYESFADWQRTNGHRVMSSRELVKRFDGHSGLPAYVGTKQATADRPGLSRPGHYLPDGLLQELPARPRAVVGLRFTP